MGMVALGLYAPIEAYAADAHWVKAESEHFTVYSDTDAKTAAAYLTRLEQYRYILARFHGFSAEDDAEMPKVKIYFVSTFRDLKQTWPTANDDVRGYYKDCTEDQAAVAMYLDDGIHKSKDAKGQAENASQTVLFHEYAHTFMFQTSEVIYPQWFVEGYAEYYGTTKIQGDTAVIGMAFSWRIPDLIRPGALHLRYEDILRNTWRGRHEDPAKTEAFYAQSWLLTHYILSDPQRVQQMSSFIAAYGRGDDPVKAFEASFGIPVAELDKTLSRYLDKMMAEEYRIKDMPSPDIKVTPMPVSANRLLLWDVADRLCPAPAGRAALLDNIRNEAAKYPGDDYAQMTLARAEIIIGDESKPLDYLKTYTAAHPDDADAWFMLGQAWFLMTMHKNILPGETRRSQLAHARNALSRAYGLDHLNAANLFYYARAQEAESTSLSVSDNAINAAVQAHNLAPSVEDYAFYAALLLIRQNRLQDAKTMLIPLASNPHQPELAERLRTVIDAIDKGATAEDVRKLLQTPPPAAVAASPASPPAGNDKPK